MGKRNEIGNTVYIKKLKSVKSEQKKVEKRKKKNESKIKLAN
jgi:hypothetical protein